MKHFPIVLWLLSILLLCSCSEIVEEENEETADITVTETVAVTSETVPETEENTPEEMEIPVYLNPDGKEFASLFGSFFHVESFSAAYGWDTGEETVYFSVEHTADEPYAGTTMLSINGGEPFDISCVSLQDIRVTREFIAVEPGYTDIGGPLWVFDYDGNLILAVYDVTAEGAEFRGLRAVDDDGITVFASRIRHMELTGGTALQLQAPYAAYQGLLWDDPTSDCLPWVDSVLPDAFSVDLSRGWDAVPDTLNPELVVSGEYRIPYDGAGQFGQIMPTANTETLQTFMETQFGERTPAVTQESVTEPVDITPPAGADLEAQVSGYLDVLTEGTDGMYSEAEIIAAHPDVFEALTSLGADALPYLEQHADSYYQFGYGSLRGIIAMMSIHAIDPTAYDYSVFSPDGSLCITAELQTLFGADWGGIRVDVYHNLNVRDVHSGEVLWENMSGDGITNPQLSWSPDGRYAVLTHGSATHFSDTTVFCVTDQTVREFPDIDQILSLAELGEDIPSYSIRAAAWREDGRLDGEFSLQFGTTAYYEGSFVFDPASGEISEFVCQKV